MELITADFVPVGENSAAVRPHEYIETVAQPLGIVYGLESIVRLYGTIGTQIHVAARNAQRKSGNYTCS